METDPGQFDALLLLLGDVLGDLVPRLLQALFQCVLRIRQFLQPALRLRVLFLDPRSRFIVC